MSGTLVHYYAQRAAEYERIYAKPERQDDLHNLRQRVGANFAGKRVFELACGTGFWTEILSTTAASVVATDINEEVLAIARSKPIDPLKTSFRREDAYALPAFPEKFNGGLAAFWWSHVPKARLRGFLAEFHKIFSPDAQVMFIDNRYVAGSSTPVSRTDAEGNSYQIRRLDDGSSHEVLKNFPDEPEIRAALDGLVGNAAIEFFPYYWTVTYRLAIHPNEGV